MVADDARVEMGHRHRRRAAGRLSVNLGVVAFGDAVVVAAQPDAADREAAITPPLGDA